MNIYISSSWKNRDRVRSIAIQLRTMGHTVYDFTDPNCRKTPEIPPEKFPEEFDPDKHIYHEYIQRPEWRAAVSENRKAIEGSDLIILQLPCGNDSHADWAYGVGMGKRSIVVGSPRKGERSPVHMRADTILRDEEELLFYLKNMASAARNDGLTNEEGRVMDALINAWNEFCSIERQHPDELRDFKDSIHRCQDLLAVRIARRTYPEGWPVKQQNIGGRK